MFLNRVSDGISAGVPQHSNGSQDPGMGPAGIELHSAFNSAGARSLHSQAPPPSAHVTQSPLDPFSSPLLALPASVSSSQVPSPLGPSPPPFAASLVAAGVSASSSPYLTQQHQSHSENVTDEPFHGPTTSAFNGSNNGGGRFFERTVGIAYLNRKEILDVEPLLTQPGSAMDTSSDTPVKALSGMAGANAGFRWLGCGWAGRALSSCSRTSTHIMRSTFGDTFRSFQSLLVHIGPAFVISVAYVDPGNFATNLTAGSMFDYRLLWVILWSNMMAIFVQCLSAKLGIVTGKNLPAMCAQHFSTRTNWVLWVAASTAAIATDLAEFIGAVLGFYLMFGVPLAWGAVLTGLITFVLAALNTKGQRIVEGIIGLLIAVVTVAYIIELFLAKPNWHAVLAYTVMPSIPAPHLAALKVSVGMLGATVMPHVIFLHSELVQHRRGAHDTTEICKHHYRMEKIDIAVAMNLAFVVNAAMTVVAAAVFHTRSMDILSIEEAHKSLIPLLGSLSSDAFGIALLVSGLSSSAVGTLSGEVILNGFIGLQIPLTVRRLITMAPGMFLLMAGYNPMNALIVSQVCLSFALPGAVIPLILLTSNDEVMGSMTNSTLVKGVGWCIVLLVLLFNSALLLMTCADLF